MNKKRIVGLAIAAIAFDVALILPGLSRGDFTLLTYSVVAWSFAAAGAVAWLRRPEHPTGRFLLLIAFLWSSVSLVLIEHPLTWTLGQLSRNLWMIALAYLILSFPGSRLKTLKNRLILGTGAFLAVVPQALVTAFEENVWQRRSIEERRLNLIHVEGFDWIGDTAAVVGDVGGLLLLAVVGFELRNRWRRTTKPARRAFTPVVIGGFTTIVLFVGLDIFLDQVSALDEYRTLIRRFGSIGSAAIPFGFVIGLLRAQARRARVGDLVVELRQLPAPDKLQAALRSSLEDPSLVVGVWVPDAKRYLTPEGRQLKLPSEDALQVATFLDRFGEPLAAIVHDRALLDDPKLVESVKAAAHFAVENERLQDEIVAQLAEVHASRARIVEAADEERKRIERNLHDGAQQRLVSLSLSLRLLGSKLEDHGDPEVRQQLEDARLQLQEALAELRVLARGIHPAVLTEGGLGPALESLAERAPLKVDLTNGCRERLPESVEVAAYYVVAEALSNVAKHANASLARISALLVDGSLQVEVADDGTGGATVHSGSGLRGLADRVNALGGSFSVSSRPGAGTTVTATIPTAPAPIKHALAERSPHPLVRHRLDRTDESLGPKPDRAALACRGIGFSYSGTRAVTEVDLDVLPSEIVGLLGTNGAGKSTLLRILAGLLEPDEGTVHLDGDDITYYPAEARARWGMVYVPGGRGAFKPLTVMENLRLFAGRMPRKELQARTEKVFDLFPELASRTQDVIAKLSRGQQQMVSLSKAFMVEPKLLLIDELCLGLAPEIAEELLQMVTSINREGIPVLFVEQSAERALRIAQRAYFLDGGKVVFAGAAHELKERDDLLRSVFLATAAKEMARA